MILDKRQCLTPINGVRTRLRAFAVKSFDEYGLHKETQIVWSIQAATALCRSESTLGFAYFFNASGKMVLYKRRNRLNLYEERNRNDWTSANSQNGWGPTATAQIAS